MEKKNVNKNLTAALFVVVAVLGYGLIGKAGNLEPSAGPAPTMKTLDEVEPRTPISQADIPLTISTPGSYYLTEDVTAAATAITVAADDVTIDLMGYALIGPDSGTNYGIYMSSRSNVEIRNGTVRDFRYGIYEGSGLGKDHRVIDVRSVSNGQRGIYLVGSGHLVKDCTASDNGTGAGGNVYGIYAAYGSTVTGNTAYDNGTSAASVIGIYADSGSTVTGNTAYNNGDGAGGSVYGIFAGFGCTVTGNTAYDNGKSAASVIGIRAGDGSTVTGNTAYNNGDGARGNVYGIYAYSGCTVTGNTARNNGTLAGGSVYGIVTGTGCTVTGNTARRNGYSATGNAYGIWLGGNNLVDQNTAYGNGTGAASATNMNVSPSCTFGTNHAP